MFSVKKIALIAIAIIAAMVLILVFWLNFQSRSRVELTNDSVTVIDQTIVNQIKNLPPTEPGNNFENGNYALNLRQSALAFAEKYGSYSNHGNFSGLDDLKSLATPKMGAYLSGLALKSGGDIEIYQGFDTRALSVDFDASTLNEEKASATVKTQRTKVVGERAETFYQDLSLIFLLVDNEWKVDEARWR